MKVRVSFDGKAGYKTFDVDQENSVGEPHFVISNPSDHRETINVNFINAAERRRFNDGVGLCRAFNTATLTAVYLTSFT